MDRGPSHKPVLHPKNENLFTITNLDLGKETQYEAYYLDNRVIRDQSSDNTNRLNHTHHCINNPISQPLSIIILVVGFDGLKGSIHRINKDNKISISSFHPKKEATRESYNPEKTPVQTQNSTQQ